MSSPHPNDTAEALKWAVKKAEEAAKDDEIVRLMHLPALKHMRDEAEREARRS